uniref:Uncharacterized protein n=1 Tax=Siphoviridae sp. ctTwu10 TaxID=2825525 RepID=A0A8S5P7S7_9CAUD|nr:MAG TPA: hypothetical protein [Siphoviridae sp. ctTwu10]
MYCGYILCIVYSHLITIISYPMGMSMYNHLEIDI